MTQHKYYDIYLLLIVLDQFISPHAFSPGGLGDIVRDQHEMTYHGGVTYINTSPGSITIYFRCTPIYPHPGSLGILPETA